MTAFSRSCCLLSLLIGSSWSVVFSYPQALASTQRPAEAASRDTVRVAGIVLKWLRGDKEANLRRVEPMIREAAAGGARIVSTTECFLDGYAIADKSIPLEKYRALGEAIPDGTFYRRLASLAGELGVFLVAGMLEADGEARYNTAVLIGPDGKLKGKYRKQRLGHERVRNTPGNTSRVFSTPHGSVGLMICADRRDKSIPRKLCSGGADFLICPSGGMFGPARNDPILQDRSRENQVTIVFVHPAEFLVTGPEGTILTRTILGDRLLIEPGERGGRLDQNRVFYFDVPLSRRAKGEGARRKVKSDPPSRHVNPFAAHIRPTEPLTPEEERKSFHLPPGFEIQLVAAEPDIQKPMNLAFDERGRMWVTGSTEYPFPVPPSMPGRDTIKILEDTNGDGRADKFTTFADGLNIPIGIYPYADGAIAFSVPYIYHFRDTDGDDRADEREILYGPLGYERDTHGLNNGFRRTFDGWLYACHGFNNVSTVEGRDGSAIEMHSGNTYRILLDGSRVEQFTWGQVNPFGMAFDPLGNIYTADCHSLPITQLLRGGYYPSFGKPHDGLGFVPPMMRHSHGSTALCGIAFYAADHFPPEYRGSIYVGNVVTCRVHRDSMTYHGSTIQAHEEPDLIHTDDPWFRPVDIRVGPDGALYVADFYNRIIGHYEVPLNHPGRDRHRGRIWRIVYRGTGEATRPARFPGDLTNATIDELIAAFRHPNLTYRHLATNRLVDGFGKAAAPALKLAWRAEDQPTVKTHGLWALHRVQELSFDLLRDAVRDRHRDVRVHAMRVLSEVNEWTPALRELVLAGLGDADGFVQRAAAEALGRHVDFDNVRPLLALHHKVPEEDSLLLHTVRMALRNQLRDPAGLVHLEQTRLSQDDARAVASVCPSLPTPASAAYLVSYLRDHSERPEVVGQYLRHAARHVPPDEVDAVVGMIREQFSEDVDAQCGLLASIRHGLQERGARSRDALVRWGRELAVRLLDSIDENSRSWRRSHVPGVEFGGSPWVLSPWPSADGNRDALFLSSLLRGEHLTGILRSPNFKLPAALSFYVAGHVGVPGRPGVAKNFVRLRLADDDEIVKESTPPRDNVARRVRWELSAYAGSVGYLEFVDGDRSPGFAWLAVGRLEPPVVSLPALAPSVIADRQKAAAQIAVEFGLDGFKPKLAEVLLSGSGEPDVRAAAARALVGLEPDGTLAGLVTLIADSRVAEELRGKICGCVARRDPENTREVLEEAVRTTPRRLQARLAQALAGSAEGAGALLDVISKGLAAPRLLLDPSVRERILAARPRDAARRIDELTANLPADSEIREKLIEERLQTFLHSKGDATAGAQIFEKNCSPCHQIDGKGGQIAPQLDGVGNRGPERVLEDVLDPNRNVDIAFRSTTYVMAAGKVISALYRRDEGQTVVVADTNGEEIALPKARVLHSAKSENSHMPDNFGEVIPPEEFYDLVAYLLTVTSKKSD